MAESNRQSIFVLPPSRQSVDIPDDIIRRSRNTRSTRGGDLNPLYDTSIRTGPPGAGPPGPGTQVLSPGVGPSAVSGDTTPGPAPPGGRPGARATPAGGSVAGCTPAGGFSSQSSRGLGVRPQQGDDSDPGRLDTGPVDGGELGQQQVPGVPVGDISDQQVHGGGPSVVTPGASDVDQQQVRGGHSAVPHDVNDNLQQRDVGQDEQQQGTGRGAVGSIGRGRAQCRGGSGSGRRSSPVSRLFITRTCFQVI